MIHAQFPFVQYFMTSSSNTVAIEIAVSSKIQWFWLYLHHATFYQNSNTSTSKAHGA